MTYDQARYDAAVTSLLAEFSWNPWFLESHWPENDSRVSLMARNALERFSTGCVLDIGCANGAIACLFRDLGYQVTAIDAYPDERRDELFHRKQIEYRNCNLNDASPLEAMGEETFDIVLLGEVIEHILNFPLGLLQGIHRVLRPGGVLILTTPNPSTLINAVRLLRDRNVMWGTEHFLRERKIANGDVISRADMHYHEYQAWLLSNVVRDAGFTIERTLYCSPGISRKHSRFKQMAKRFLSTVGLSSKRLFAANYLLVARK